MPHLTVDHQVVLLAQHMVLTTWALWGELRCFEKESLDVIRAPGP